MPAKIRKNPDQTICEIITPDGETYLESIDPDDAVMFCSEDQRKFLAVLGENEYNLKPDAVYELLPVETIVELGAEIAEAEEEEE